MNARRLLLAFALTLVLPRGVSAQRTKSLAVGDEAPDLELFDQEKKPLKLSEVLSRRKYAVVAFYVKAFTGG